MKISVVLFTSKTLVDGTHPIMLRLFRNKKYHHRSLGISCKVADWNLKEQECRKSFPRSVELNRIIRDRKSEAQQRLDGIIANKTTFSAEAVFGATEDKEVKTLIQVVEEHRSQYNKFNTIEKYSKLIRKLRAFGYEKLAIDQVDVHIVNSFYNKIKEGRKGTTIYTYMAVFDASLNTAVLKGYISENPFKYTKFKYNKTTKKRALSRSDMAKLIAHFRTSLAGPPLFKEINTTEYALNLFIASYYLQGLSLVDLAHLKVKDVVFSKRPKEQTDWKKFHEKNALLQWGKDTLSEMVEDSNEMTQQVAKEINEDILEPKMNTSETYEVCTIETTRAKTNKAVKIVIANAAKGHIFFNTLDRSKEDYLFTIFNEKCKGNEKYKIHRLTYVTNMVNKNLRSVAQKLKLSIENLTLYCARHTYASTLYHSGISPSLIAQNLGRDMRDIDVYLQQFDDEKIIEANNVL